MIEIDYNVVLIIFLCVLAVSLVLRIFFALAKWIILAVIILGIIAAGYFFIQEELPTLKPEEANTSYIEYQINL